MTKIVVCKHNFSKGTEEVINRIKDNYEEVSIEVSPCIDACSQCGEGPFAIIDGDVVSEENTDQLYETIIKKL